MNDTLKQLLNKALLGGAAFFAGRYHLSGDQTAAIFADVTGVITLIGGVMHANKIAAKAAAVAVLSFLLMPLGGHAVAQTLPIKAPVVTPAVNLTNWSGFYAGAGMTGLNQGADVIGGGLASFNAGGTVADAHIGYMTVNAQYLLGLETGVGYLASIGDTATPQPKWSGYLDFRAGGSLTGLFGTPAQNGGPFNLNAMLANVMPYVHAGPLFSGNRTISGLGVYVPLNNVFLTVQYDYATPGGSVQQSQGARIGVNWAF